jgi:hypothetical protein
MKMKNEESWRIVMDRKGMLKMKHDNDRATMIIW